MKKSLDTNRLVNKLNLQYLIILIIFICSLSIRIYKLGELPLSDTEASNVMDVIRTNTGEENYSYNSVDDFFITYMFSIFGINSFSARLTSALIGSLIVFFPMVLKKNISSTNSIIFALFLAFDPILINLSRLADSKMIALVTFMFGMAFLLLSQAWMAGICFGVYFLCGLPTWNGVLILIIVLLLLAIRNLYKKSKVIGDELVSIFHSIKNRQFWLGILSIIGLSFIIFPSTISVITSGLIEFTRQLFSPNLIYIPKSSILLIFISCYPLFIFLFCCGLLTRDRNQKNIHSFMVLSFISILLTLALLPSANILDVSWLVIPLYLVSANGAAYLIEHFRTISGKVFLISIPILSSFVFIYLLLLRVVSFQSYTLEIGQILISIIAIVFFLLLMLIILAWGWSIRLGVNGFTTGLMIILLIHQLSITAHSTGVASRPEQEVWRSSGYFQDAHLLKEIISDIVEWNRGTLRKIDVVLLNSMDDNILWELKEYDIKSVNDLAPNEKPSLLITGIDQIINHETNYLKQRFVRNVYPQWLQDPIHALINSDFYEWLFLRMGSLKEERMILWARNDLFPGNSIYFEVD